MGVHKDKHRGKKSLYLQHAYNELNSERQLTDKQSVNRLNTPEHVIVIVTSARNASSQNNSTATTPNRHLHAAYPIR